MLVEEPLQTLIGLPVLRDGKGFTVIFTESVLEQPVEVIVSVSLYSVVAVGLTDGLLFVDVNPEGLLVQL